MDQVLEFFQKLFDVSDWPPRWHCGNWTEFHGWLYIISDLLIWSAYFAIPLAILKFIARRVDPRFIRTYFLFAAFILACGSTHLLDAITFWFPAYRLNALVRFATGIISWATVFHIIRIMPMALSLPTHAELEKEINERKRVEEELKVLNTQLNTAQEIAKVGHWQWDVKADTIAWSRELYKIFEVEQNTPLSYETYLLRIHPDDRELVNNTVTQAMADKNFPVFTHRILSAVGSEKVVQARGEVVLNEQGEVARLIGVAQDITEQQKAQQQLVERTNDLEIMNAELQKFAYVASHDLQEPLRKIRTFASMLDQEVKGKVGENAQLYMDKIVQASGRMQRLIDDILQFSSLKAVSAAYTTVDLDAVVRQVLSDMEVKIETAGAEVRMVPLPTLEAIPSQMGQLFQNLLSNAIKFTKEGQKPVVTISCERLLPEQVKTIASVDSDNHVRAFLRHYWNREQFVRITVQDNGIGFEPGYASKIFEIFQRLHAARTYEGTGIGLAICKKIVDNHHGTITAESRPGEGARFVIVLPLSQKNFFSE